ncbi:MAG: hypothetical protein WCH37_09620 [Synechococcaceae cyanobacterium ELA182]
MPLAGQASGLKSSLGFQGTTINADAALNSGVLRIPPDTMGAIGLSQFLETSNGSISVYDRSNGSLVNRQNLGSFWSAVSPNLSDSGGDQRVLFDHYTNRWIVIGFGATRNTINIAVSSTDNALGTWKGVTLAVLSSGNTADYPTLGIDEKGVYIGTNNFTGLGSFTGSSLIVLSKSDLFASVPVVNGLTFDGGATSTFQGAVNWQGNPGATANILFTDRTSPAASSIDRAVISGVGTATPTVQSIQNNAVTYSTQLLSNAKARQPNGSQVIDTLDTRLSANVYQANGKLYGVRTVTPDNPIGTAGTSSALQWFVLNAASGAMIETGLIGGDGFDYFQPSIAVNAWGEAVIGYNRSGGAASGVAGNISFLAQAFRTDGLGGLDAYGDSLLLRRSDTSAYNLDFGTGRYRWGDYSAVSLDPLDGRSFWAIGEYAPASNSWGTYIAALQLESVPGPVPLLGAGSAFLWSRRLRRRIACSHGRSGAEGCSPDPSRS